MKRLGQSGFSLIEVMIVAGILGVLALGISAVTVMSQKSTMYDQYKRESVNLQEEIRSTLADQTACKNTFGAFTFDSSKKIAVSIPSVRDNGAAGGAQKYIADNSTTYSSDTVKIVSLQFTPNPNGVVSGNLEAQLDIVYTPAKTGAMGPQSSKAATVMIAVQQDAGHFLVSCIALGKATDTIWTVPVAAGGSFQDTSFNGAGNVLIPNGKIGIGTTPTGTSKLQVAGGDIKVGAGDITIDSGQKLQLDGGAGKLAVTGDSASGSLTLNTNNTPRLYVGSSGRIGIGSTTPTTALDVNGSGAFAGGMNVAGAAIVGGKIDVTGNLNAHNNFYVDGNSNVTGAMKVTGSTTLAGDVSAGNKIFSKYFLYNSSDRRLKDDITPITEKGPALARLLTIVGVYWKWKSNHEPAIGVVAQDVQKQFPELVVTRPDGYLAVNYEGLVGVVLEAVRELNTNAANAKIAHEKEVAKLQEQINTLRRQNLNLQQRLESIESRLSLRSPASAGK